MPARQVGVLTTDVDCGSNTLAGSYGVELGRSATLDMQGHGIAGAQWRDAGVVVRSVHRVRVFHPRRGSSAARPSAM